MKLNRKFYKRFFSISIILCLVGMIGSNIVRRDYNRIEVKDFSIVDANGHLIAATMYKPDTATPENKAPAVVGLHGSYNARESLSYMMFELARRGYVGITIDCDGHGDSENYKDNPMDAFFLVTARPGSDFNSVSTAPTSGMAPMVEYVYNELDFVDSDRIGITGHSLGGKSASATFAFYKIQEYLGGENKIASVFLVDNQQLNIDGVWQDYLVYDPDDKEGTGDEVPLYYDVDYGVSGAKYDENNYHTEVGGPWNFYKSNNARTFINELDNYSLEKDQEVERGKYYKGPVQGSEEEYLRVIFQPKEIHMLGPYSIASNSNAVDFFQRSLGAPNEIDSRNMVYPAELAFNLLGMIGFFLAIYSFCCLLLTTEFFGALLAEDEKRIFRPNPPKSTSAKIYYWLFMIVGSIIPTLWMMPLAMWVGGHKGETFAARSLFGTKIWPAGLQLEQALWVASAGLWTILLFVLRYQISTKKEGTKISQFNLKISGKNIGKTLLLAMISVGMGYMIVGIARYFFGSYFGLLNYIIRWPNKNAFLVTLRYMPLFFIFYFSNAFTQNYGRMVSGRPEWANTLLMCFINALGLLLVWIYQYYTFSKVGKVPLNSARIMQTWSFFIVQSLCTIFVRRLYLKTGKIYLGSIINTIMFTMIACCHTMILNVGNWWF